MTRRITRRYPIPQQHQFTPPVTENLLSALDETNVWQVLAAQPEEAHIVAPGPVLQRVLAHVDNARFSSSGEMPTESRARTVFVWDLDRAKLSEARKSHPSHSVRGILRDVWCAAVTGGSICLADAQTSHPGVNYAILCPPRSGSTFLCDLLKEAGLGNPLEHIRPCFIELCRAGFSFEELMGWMIQRGSGAGYFGTKLISHCIQELEETGVSLGSIRRFLRQRNFRIVQLLRDPAEEAVSGHFAVNTGVWHLRAPAVVETRHDDLAYNVEDLHEAYRLMAAENRFVTEFGNRLAPVLEIHYCELDQDPLSTIAKVAEFLGASSEAAFRIDLTRTVQKISSGQRRMQEHLARLRHELAERAIDPS